MTDHGDVNLYDAPAYRATEAAHMLALPAGTVKAWCFGQDHRLKDGRRKRFRALIQPALDAEDVKKGALLKFEWVEFARSWNDRKERLVRKQAAKRSADHPGLVVPGRRKAGIHEGYSRAKATCAAGCLATHPAANTTREGGPRSGFPCRHRAQQPTRNSREAKKAFQKLCDSARSEVADDQSLLNAMARDLISFQLSGMRI